MVILCVCVNKLVIYLLYNTHLSRREAEGIFNV